VSVWYLDTSAALKLLIEEPESPPLAQTVDREQPDLVACWLLETELRRAAQRLGLAMDVVSEFLTGVSLYEMPGSLFREAGILPGETLRSLDALHLAAAVRIGVDLVLTYDVRMAESARQLGLPVLSPG
jgi:predicted nucleic acid-binding protein